VLVVDDDPLLVEVLALVLGRSALDLSVETCQSSRVAVQKAALGHYDAAILDLTMPELDGMAMLAHIRNARPCTSCLLMTGHNELRIAEQAFTQGAFDFIGKPFNTDYLLWSVAWAVRMHRLQRRVDERRGHLRELLGALERRWETLHSSVTAAAAIGQSRSLMRASLEQMAVAVTQTETLVQRAERRLRWRQEQVHRKARQRLSLP